MAAAHGLLASAQGMAWSRRLALGVLIAALGYIVYCGLFGLDAPLAFGHHGYHVGEYVTRARHTLRHASILPQNLPGWNQPPLENLYLHHPILTHQLVTLTVAVLGETLYAVRLAALLYTLSAFFALVWLVWRCAGPWASAVAGVVFAVVPIHVWFGTHIDPGFGGLACLLLFLVAYFRFLDTGTFRAAGSSLALASLAGFFEWSPYLAAAPIFVHMLWSARRGGRFAVYPLLYGVCVSWPLAFHAALVVLTHHLPEMKESYANRTVLPAFSTLLMNLRGFSDDLFGRPLVLATGLYVLTRPVGWLFRRGSRLDLVGMTLLFTLGLYVRLFAIGVTIHQYRLLYGGTLVAVAVAGLSVDASALGLRILSFLRLRRVWPRLMTPGVALGSVGLVLISTLGLSLRGLYFSRLTGGGVGQRRADPQLSRIEFVVAARELSQRGDVAYVHHSFHLRKELYYYLDRDIGFWPSLGAAKTLSPAALARALVLCTPRAMTPAERVLFDGLAAKHPVHFVDDFAILDLREERAALTVSKTAPPMQRRSPWRRYFEGPHTRLSLVRLQPPPESPPPDQRQPDNSSSVPGSATK